MSAAAQAPAPTPGENWQLQIPLTDLGSTASLARRLVDQLGRGDLLVLAGELGAGKTTFTQNLAAALDVEGRVSSPTFVLSRIHPSRADRADAADLVHVDAYRTDAEGLESLDLRATMMRSVTVVEWGRGLVEQVVAGPEGSWLDLELVRPEPARPDRRIITDFSETEEDLPGSSRTAVLRGYGARWSVPPEALTG